MISRYLSGFFFISVLLFFSLNGFSVEKSPTLIVRVPGPMSKTDTRAAYDIAIVELALSKTRDEGPYQVVKTPPMSQTRALKNLHDNTFVDVVATTSAPERERDLLAIPYSIHKELMGVKIFLIRKDREKDFAKIRTLSELTKLVGGQGHDWPDVEILRANGLTITSGSNYEGLFKMLEVGRFDYFPRSLPEVFDETKVHKDKGLIVEPTLALVYPVSAFMFVNKQNTTLGARLKRGMERAIKDGSFEKLFQEKHGENIEKADLKKRRIFFLRNPMKITPPHEYTIDLDKGHPLN